MLDRLLVSFQPVATGEPTLLGCVGTVCQVAYPRLAVFITMLAAETSVRQLCVVA